MNNSKSSVNFFVNYNEQQQVPQVNRIKFNDIQICPEDLKNCTKLDIRDLDTESCNGFLQIYPNQDVTGRNMQFVFDGNLLAFAASV